MDTAIEKIAENNYKILKKYNIDTYINSQNLYESNEGGDLYMQNYLNSDQFELFKNSSSLKDNFDILKERQLVNEILKNDVCLITIRPEMTHYCNRIVDFFIKRNLIPIYSLKHKLNRYQYWDIYHRAITNPDARNTMATRTLVYTSSDVITIVFKNFKKNYERSCVEFVYNELKGTSGEYVKNTLRGDLIRKEAQRMKLNNINMDKITALAIDPFATYRNMLKSQKGLSNKLLMYTAVSVHIPNKDELGRDLSVLLNSEQLTSIINKL